MDAFFLQLKKMFDNELYANVLPIANIMESAYDRDRSLLTNEQYFLLQMYNGNSLFNERQYQKAESVYRKALFARKSLIKSKNATPYSNNYENLTEMFPETEICYKLAQCLEHTKQLTEAICVLQLVAHKHRTIKMNMMIGRLFQQTGRLVNAVMTLKTVLRDCPFNLEVIKSLMMLQVSDVEIESIISGSNLPAQCTEWLSSWIDAYTCMFRCKFTDAIGKLQAIEHKSQFVNNEVFQVLIGQCYYYNGEIDKALQYLVMAYSKNPYLIDGLMTLAALYALKGRINDLERLTLPAVSVSDYSSEHWFVCAQLFFTQGKYDKASYFAHKACFLNPKNVEATLLKAKGYLHLNKFTDAIAQFKMLLEFAAYRFEIYDGLVTCYINTQRLREAHILATDAVRLLGKTSRTYVLVSRPLLSDLTMKSKARPFLEKALEIDKNCMPAAQLLVELLIEEDNTAEAIKVIKKIVAIQPTAVMFSMLGDIHSSINDSVKAVEYYTKAINLDPGNKAATDGLLSLEQASSMKNASFEEPMAINDGNEYQENNFEMIEVQPMTPPTPPNEILPDLDPESDAIWANVDGANNS